MSRDEGEDSASYKVVINDEAQYSIWPADRANALGWNDAGKAGTRAECLAYIKEVWTDLKPLSLRKKVEERKKDCPDTPDAMEGSAVGLREVK